MSGERTRLAGRPQDVQVGRFVCKRCRVVTWHEASELEIAVVASRFLWAHRTCDDAVAV